jgi:hypothetical protein
MPRPLLLRAAALAGTAALLTVGLAIPASAAGATVTVLIADISDTNVSILSTKWDNAGTASAAALPATGTRWALDIENKPKGTSSITADGLVLTVDTDPAPATVAPPIAKKVRYQYYIGSGGYPALDGQAHKLKDLLASEVSWDLKLLSGETTYGPVFQVQLQRQLTNGSYARVTVQSVWNPGTGHKDLGAGLWFANTAIYADGYPTGLADGYAPRAGIQVLNAAGSGPGVTAEVLKANFGEFEVVSFGPGLGRDFAYSYAFQNITAFGQTFVFSEHAPAPPAPPAASGTTSGGTTTGSSPRTGSTGGSFAAPAPTPTPTDDQLETLAVPPAASSDTDGDDETVEAADATPELEPASSTSDFPWWLLILGGGVLLFVLAMLAWLFRRRAV